MVQSVTELSMRQFVARVSDQHHAVTGAVIAASAAQAAALAEACMQISLDNQVDKLDWRDVSARIEEMAHIKNTLIEWCNHAAETIDPLVSRPEAADSLSNRDQLCHGPAEISRLSLDAAVLMQAFRPLAFEPVEDDLEMTLTLLAGTARAAMLLLDSLLRIWPEPALLKIYEPILDDLIQRIEQVTPVNRIRAGQS